MDHERSTTATAEDEVAGLVTDLIRIDTRNAGDGTGPGEADAAKYCEQRLIDVGLSPERFATTSDSRQGVHVRLPGTDKSRPALLIHGHLDVVPTPESDWRHAPLSGDIDDEGVLWGRGAVDMKDMDGMMLAVARLFASGVEHSRDLVFLFTPDEEAGGIHGARWITTNRPEFFDGVTEAIGEVGAFSQTIADDVRLYPIQVAEKGGSILKLTATGDASHGSLKRTADPLAQLARAIARIDDYVFPVHMTDAMQTFLEAVATATGRHVDLVDPDNVVDGLGPIARVVASTVRNTANVTMVNAGHKANVVPSEATAIVDTRAIPGKKPELLQEVHDIVGPDIEIEEVFGVEGITAPSDAPIVAAMASALRAEDDGALVVPYVMPGGTDAKAFSTRGINCYGFSPLMMSPTCDFWGMFHAANERVPVSGLQFGVRVLHRFLRDA